MHARPYEITCDGFPVGNADRVSDARTVAAGLFRQRPRVKYLDVYYGDAFVVTLVNKALIRKAA